jgi:putative inorganic carbon (hco3(-)) transporter
MKGLLLVFLLTYGGAALALFRPFYGLLAYMIFAVLRPDHLWSWSLPLDGHYSKIVGIGLLVGWVLNGLGDWELGKAQPIFILLIVYWLCMVASAAFASNQEVAWKHVILHSKILLPVILGMTIVTSIAEVRLIAWTIVACLGFLAYEAHNLYFEGRGIEFRDRGMLGMDNNSFCISMAAGTGIAIFLGFSEPNLLRKGMAFSLAALMVHVPMFGESRGGLLGITVVGVVAFLLLPKRAGMLTTYAIGSLVALRLAGPAVVSRFSTIFADSENRDVSAQSRLDLWTDCWDVMIHNPILGIGPDHWPLVAKDYGWPPGKEAHSLWFNCGAELGFTGLGLLSAVYVCTILLAWRYLHNSSRPEYRDIGRMTIAALSGFMVSASFVSLDALELPFYIVLIAVGGLKVACLKRTFQAQADDMHYAVGDSFLETGAFYPSHQREWKS